MAYFDFHAHPSLKGSLTDNPVKYNAWNTVGIYWQFQHLLKKLTPVINSQASLSQLKTGPILTCVPLIALEKAFARNFIIYRILASEIVSPLYRPLLDDVLAERKTYFEMFERDLSHLLDALQVRPSRYVLMKKNTDYSSTDLNIILSVEGAHSFQSVGDSEGDQARHESIIYNFSKIKSLEQF